MGSQAAKYIKKGVDYVTGSNDDEAGSSSAMTLHSNINFSGTPFVLTRSSSMYFDEDGHLAHEFYKETHEKNGGRVKLKKITKGLRRQGNVKLEVPRLNVDFPIVIYEG